jgi:hypothetical protein
MIADLCPSTAMTWHKKTSVAVTRGEDRETQTAVRSTSGFLTHDVAWAGCKPAKEAYAASRQKSILRNSTRRGCTWNDTYIFIFDHD